MLQFALRVGLFGLLLGLTSDGGRGDDNKPVDLKVGDKAPAFEARTDADTTWESAGRVGKKWVEHDEKVGYGCVRTFAAPLG